MPLAPAVVRLYECAQAFSSSLLLRGPSPLPTSGSYSGLCSKSHLYTHPSAQTQWPSFVACHAYRPLSLGLGCNLLGEGHSTLLHVQRSGGLVQSQELHQMQGDEGADW